MTHFPTVFAPQDCALLPSAKAPMHGIINTDFLKRREAMLFSMTGLAPAA
jgi:hypothetical protein